MTDNCKESARHYNYYFHGRKLDPYRILSIYRIADPAQAHAIKKLLRAGDSVKSYDEDVQETIDTLNRLLEMRREDNE
jgi:hypothetical protein